ncbi:4'-phosphopantetheinyl transferase [Tenacibaculum finnmarkense genomovar ulcerans]|uniref:restriction endonuclease subunit S n=1 Tax=Tenacibaculum finnmarkense TaxID=2781243 RepID=UPI00187B7CDF|nr:restriction endonuclease subunit S [Tenacibaculum finnmarkense]MBE7634103.1 4'-phosphopantetheinyl transferase [Tenacibaculum finnmarkense genomovar ulcerans]MCD8429859.1 restriction endonuclease subunit S [Tenacibaculum finnmarkense genomovar ulcerans]
MESKLPKNWVLSKLDDLSVIKSGGTPSRGNKDYWNGEIPWVKISDLKEWYINSTTEFITEKGLNNSSTKIFPKGTILFTIFASIGKVGVLNIDACTNQAIAGITPVNEIEHKFLTYSLIELSEILRNQGKGIAQKNINLTILKDLNVPLPPLAEQQRIVTKLDTLFGSLDALKIRLNNIPQLIKNFKQAVLTQAVTGKLTQEWRVGKELVSGDLLLLDEIKKSRNEILNKEILNGKSESKRLLNKIKKLEFEKPEELLPKNWIWTCLLESCLKVVDCHNKTAPYVNEGIRLLRTTNIKEGKIHLKGSKFITEETYNFWSKRCPPKANDILFTREAPMGETAIIPKNMKICMGQRMMLLRTIPELLDSKFLLYNILSFSFQQRMISNAIGTGVKHLRVGDVERLTFPLPPKEEQTEIVKRVENLFSKADAIEKQYKTLKEKIDRLPQAILAKAFKGELVAQLPTDGDAKDLLEEIKKLKESLVVKPKKKVVRNKK